MFAKRAVLAMAVAGLISPAMASAAPKSFSAREQPMNVDVGLRAGVNGWTGDLGERTAVGQMAGVQASKNFGQVFGLEAAYEGSRNLIVDDSRVTAGSGLWRHNVSTGVKLGAYVTDRLRPFAAAGVGLSYIDPNGRAEGAYRSDFVTELPLSVGLDYTLASAFSLGARATYRMIGDEEFTNPSPGESTDGGLLSAGIGISARF